MVLPPQTLAIGTRQVMDFGTVGIWEFRFPISNFNSHDGDWIGLGPVRRRAAIGLERIAETGFVNIGECIVDALGVQIVVNPIEPHAAILIEIPVTSCPSE
jgi:hypothetical protein